MSILDPTAEKLRSKHIRTLEAFQKQVEENELLKAQLALASSSGQVATDDSSDLRDQLEAAQRQVGTLEQRIQSLTESHAKQSEELRANWSAKHAGLEAKFDEQRRLHASIVQELKQQLAALATPRAPPAAPAKTAVGVQAELGDERLRELEQVIAEQGKQIQSLKYDLEVAMGNTKRLDTVLTAKAAVEGQLADVQAQLAKLHKASIEKDARITALEAEMAAAAQGRKASHGGLAAQLAALRQQLETETSALKSQVAAFKQAAEAAQAGSSRWEAQAQALAKEVETLRAELVARMTDADADAGTPRGKGAQFAEFVSLKKENQMLRMQIELMKEERQKYVARMRRGRVGL